MENFLKASSKPLVERSVLIKGQFSGLDSNSPYIVEEGSVSPSAVRALRVFAVDSYAFTSYSSQSNTAVD